MVDFPLCGLPGCADFANQVVHAHGRRIVACGEHGSAVRRLLDKDQELRDQQVKAPERMNGVVVKLSWSRSPDERSDVLRKTFNRNYGAKAKAAVR